MTAKPTLSERNPLFLEEDQIFLRKATLPVESSESSNKAILSAREKLVLSDLIRKSGFFFRIGESHKRTRWGAGGGSPPTLEKFSKISLLRANFCP